MLLVVFTLWLAACSFTASLLKDFRAYGAALAGYTLAIVAITDIDMPQSVFLTALDRVAAILVGVASLALVNGIFGRADAWQALVSQLRVMIAETTEQAIRTSTRRSGDSVRCGRGAAGGSDPGAADTGNLRRRRIAGRQAARGGCTQRCRCLAWDAVRKANALAAGLAQTQPDAAIRSGYRPVQSRRFARPRCRKGTSEFCRKRSSTIQ